MCNSASSGSTLSGTPTITGGMAFAGGPFNNFVYQATAEMVRALRGHPGALGLVTTVCGLLTKPGLAIWSTAPDDQPALLRDFAREAATETAAVEVEGSYQGPATVASATVTYEGLDPVRGGGHRGHRPRPALRGRRPRPRARRPCPDVRVRRHEHRGERSDVPNLIVGPPAGCFGDEVPG